MPASFVATSGAQAATANTASVSWTVPASVQAGDYLILHYTSQYTTYNAPSGWTLLGQVNPGGSPANPTMRVWGKVATAGDAGSAVALTLAAGSDATFKMVGAIVAYRGIRAAQFGVASGSGSSTSIPPAVGTGDAVAGVHGWIGPTTPGSSFEGNQRVACYGSQGSSGKYVWTLVNDWLPGGTHTAGPRASLGSNGTWVAATLRLIGNTAPNAPTLTSPATNASIDRGITQRFAWDFSDPDAGDSQSKFDLQYRTVGGSTWTAVTGTTPNTYWDAAAGTFAAGDYEWQVRTYDSQGVVGPWSSSSFFTAADAPAAPTITAPTSGATVSSSETLTWSAPNQDDYQWRRVRDNAGSADTGTVYADSGDVVSSTVRSVTVAFDANNRYEHLQVRIKDNGLWSAWSDIRVQVAYTPPDVPTFTLTPDNDLTSPTAGSLLVAITNGTTSATATAYNNVYVTDPGDAEERRATNVPTNGTWRYWDPPSGFDGTTVGRIRVEAVGSNGTTASS